MTSASAALCELLGIERPIVQAGMGFVTTGRLAAAVSGAGGLGVVATGGYMRADELRAHVERVRDEAPGRSFGVNLLFSGGASGDEFGNAALLRAQLDVCVGERVPVVIGGFGDPRPALPELRAAGIRFLAVVGSTRAALRMAEAGADAVIVSGFEAGGHVGRVGTLTLAQSALRALDLPVLVAGGVATRAAVEAALGLGAGGVSVGTRFVASEESDAHPGFKQAVVDAGEGDTAVTRALTGKPNRGLRTPFVEAWIERDSEIESFPGRAREHWWRSRSAIVDGNLVEGFAPMGECSALVGSVLPAATIVEQLAP